MLSRPAVLWRQDLQVELQLFAGGQLGAGMAEISFLELGCGATRAVTRGRRGGVMGSLGEEVGWRGDTGA